MALTLVVWFYSRGLPKNPNASGPLTDNKDFSFVDGRPTPLGKGQKRRIISNQLLAVICLFCSSSLELGT